MRPGQQNRRMRGRGNNNNNNRKGPNPLTRTYESNGPDVKIRGTAQQVADKYATLARDAQSSGDRVMAENYLQHAEHYNRIIATAQAQQQAQQQASRDEDGDEDNQPNAAQANVGDAGSEDNGSKPQPVIEGTPVEVASEQDEAAANNGGRPRRARPRRAQNEGDKAETQATDGNAEQAEASAGEDERPRRGRPRRRRDEAADGDAPAADGDKKDVDQLPAFLQG